jgi:ProP effector
MSKPSLIVALAERFPLAFVLVKQRRPLRVGVCKDIIATCPDIDAEQLSRALGWYTNGVGYLTNLKEGTARIDLDGAQAGVVTAAEAEGARARLKALFKRRRKQAKAAAPKGAPRAANAGSPHCFLRKSSKLRSCHVGPDQGNAGAADLRAPRTRS